MTTIGDSKGWSYKTHARNNGMSAAQKKLTGVMTSHATVRSDTASTTAVCKWLPLSSGKRYHAHIVSQGNCCAACVLLSLQMKFDMLNIHVVKGVDNVMSSCAWLETVNELKACCTQLYFDKLTA